MPSTVSSPIRREPSRRERRRLEIRERIVETALALFEAQGYESTTVTQIARAADIAYGTFFNHFPSKLHLLREVSDLALRDLFENVEEVGKRPGTFSEHLVTLFETSCERAEAKGPQARELISAMMALAFPETAGNDDRRIRLAFRSFLEEGIESGELRDDVDLDTMTEIVVGTWYSMFLSWVHFEEYPLLERATKAARFLARALTYPAPERRESSARDSSASASASASASVSASASASALASGSGLESESESESEED